jgi:hypothetical protein
VQNVVRNVNVCEVWYKSAELKGDCTPQIASKFMVRLRRNDGRGCVCVCVCVIWLIISFHHRRRGVTLADHDGDNEG